MALITSQQLAQYYELYKQIDVTFNKQVARAIGLITKQTFLRFLGYQLTCIIYSSSMLGAKVIASVNQALFQKIREANNLVSLRFCFQDADKPDPISFFVAAKIVGFNPYSQEHQDLNFITVKYTQRPSDDLISIIGQLLEANINSKKRREERVEIDPDSIRKIGLASKDTILFVDDVPRKAILRDISFSGAKVLVTGVAKFLTGKVVRLKLLLDDGKESFILPGKIVRFDEFQEQKGIGAAGIQFDEPNVPMEYKMRLNEYLVTLRRPPA